MFLLLLGMMSLWLFGFVACVLSWVDRMTFDTVESELVADWLAAVGKVLLYVYIYVFIYMLAFVIGCVCWGREGHTGMT